MAIPLRHISPTLLVTLRQSILSHRHLLWRKTATTGQVKAERTSSETFLKSQKCNPKQARQAQRLYERYDSLSEACANLRWALEALRGCREDARQDDIAALFVSASLCASTGTADSFVVVTMTNGQVLYGAIGCEVMLRVGTASVVSPSSPGLIDSTGGTTLDNGAGLTKNHLYMMTISDRGVKATAATTKLLVRGTYEVR